MSDAASTRADADPDEQSGESTQRRGLSRRDLLVGGSAGLGLGLLGAAGGVSIAGRPQPSALGGADATTTAGRAVPSRGRHQAGIVRPATPQRHGLIVVADLPGEPSRDDALAAIAAAGEAIDALTDPATADSDVLPDGVGDLTVTLGIGPRVVRAIDTRLPGADPLPSFAGDDAMPAEHVGGDLLIAVHSSDVNACLPVADAVMEAVPGATVRWAQAGARGPGEGTVARSPLGYHDGVIVPRTDAELDSDVWIADGTAAGGTIAVIRRLRLDLAAFRALDRERRDAIVGRRHGDGAPLSGGTLMDEANLLAKSPEGDYLVPPRAHVRAAHPSFTGSALMLRRGYGFSNAVAPGAEPDEGLLFICFQHDLDVFVRTQHRLDETDDLMAFAQATASASFLILPGRTGDAPLGATLA